MWNKTRFSSAWLSPIRCASAASLSVRCISRLIVITILIVFLIVNVFQLPIKTQLIESVVSTILDHEICTLDYINSKRLQQDHPCVIEIIRRDYLRLPSPRQVPYNLSKPEVVDPSAGQTALILSRLNNQTNGFFVESGANDGEYLSNTLYMERFLNWNGILIEPIRRSYDSLLSLNRKSHSFPICLSLEPYPTHVEFNDTVSTRGGKMFKRKHQSSSTNEAATTEHYKVQCFPFYSILLAVGQTSIDFFSLDVEGVELKILKTIPWQKVDIKALTVEWNHIPEGDLGLTSYMEANGYVMTDDARFSWGHDLIFIKKSAFENLLEPN